MTTKREWNSKRDDVDDDFQQQLPCAGVVNSSLDVCVWFMEWDDEITGLWLLLLSEPKSE